MSWTSIADLLTDDASAPIALLGAPMEAGSVTPGRCDLAPGILRRVGVSERDAVLLRAAQLLRGPWTFATPSLPADFTNIPLEHEQSRVLASVPGKVQAAQTRSAAPQRVEM